MTGPYLRLCWCHHPLGQHVDGVDCKLCDKCKMFNPVSSKSGHVYRTGSPTVSRRLDRLSAGQRVLLDFGEDDGLIPTHKLRGSLVARVVGLRYLRTTPRSWVLTTDLGPLPALSGATTMTVVTPVGMPDWE